MAEVLNSQRAKQAQPCDFAQPQLLSQKQRAELLEALQQQAKALSHAFATAFELECQVSIEEVHEVSSRELGAASIDPTFDCHPAVESGRILCSPDAQLTQLLVEKMLGGAGTLRSVERPATDIETALMQQALDIVHGVWQSEGAEPVDNPVQFIAGPVLAKQPALRGIGVEYSVRIGEAARPLRVFATYKDVTEVTKVRIGAQPRPATASEPLTTHQLRGTYFKLRAQMPPVPIRIRDLRLLRVGDVVQLNRKVTDEVQVAVGNKVVFVGHPGTRHGNVGIRISRAVRT